MLKYIILLAIILNVASIAMSIYNAIQDKRSKKESNRWKYSKEKLENQSK